MLALNDGESLITDFQDINGLFYTSGGQCLSAKAIRVRRLIGRSHNKANDLPIPRSGIKIIGCGD
jgi:hypothetical protein